MAEDGGRTSGFTDRWRLSSVSDFGGYVGGGDGHQQQQQQPNVGGSGGGKPKRSQACVSCRRQKMKCQFSVQSDPPRCDRCRQANIECKFEIRANDKQWTSSVEERLKRLEDTLAELMDLLQNNNIWGASPIGEGHWAHQHPPVVNPAPSTKRAHATKDLANGLLSGLIGSRRGSSNGQDSTSNNESPEPPAKRTRVDLDDTSLVESAEARECIEFFNAKLARYLPILVFKYLPQFDVSVQKRSPILFLSILSVASLYHPAYQARHSTFRKEFETVADSLDYKMLASGESNLNQVVDVIVALSLAGAWLGGELGFRMSVTASNLAGTVFPLEQDRTSPDETAKRELISAIGLMTYIIEQRLRIIHARPIDPNQIVNGKRRDVFFAQFLASLMKDRKGHHHEMDVAELKITANVELCAVILMLQLDLRQEVKIDVLTHWNNQLDKWLSEWMGKLTVNLLPSSWKPVFLTFHFAKLFLNSMAVSNVKKPMDATWAPPVDPNMDPEQRKRFTKAAENSALDVLDMLIRDRDIERLIAVAPVFYPTIFITACAWLLKLLTITRSIGYAIDEEKVIRVARSSYNILSTKLAAPVLPCNPSVRNLGVGLDKVAEHLTYDAYNQSTQPHPPPPPPQQQQPPVQQVTPMVSTSGSEATYVETPQQAGTESAGILPTNFWSFTPFRARYSDSASAQFAPESEQQNVIWQSSGEGVTDFLFDAYSSSILESLTGPNNAEM
ncbi:hypothetical protein TRICI_000735 [Trichomonascus ciferrii]|uniref:Zn(2)-C6 fungal-type domain-containing protein n=1 Tax=Trichomonascus ciferrii TaxID=44093 RepID=A0A642VB76_9ASCO|nr:hypothetical protein TRICI_000735 [Trichomonascus ciferrii]